MYIRFSFSRFSDTLVVNFQQVTLDVVDQLRVAVPPEEFQENAGRLMLHVVSFKLLLNTTVDHLTGLQADEASYL